MPLAFLAHLRVFRLWCLGSYSFGTPLVKVGPLRNVLAIVDKYLQTVSHIHKQHTTQSTQNPPTHTHTHTHAHSQAHSSQLTAHTHTYTHSSDTTSTLSLRNSAHPPPKLSCGRNGTGTSHLCRTGGTIVQCWTVQVKRSSKSMGSKVATRVRRGCSGFAPPHRCSNRNQALGTIGLWLLVVIDSPMVRCGWTGLHRKTGWQPWINSIIWKKPKQRPVRWRQMAASGFTTRSRLKLTVLATYMWTECATPAP